MSFLSSLSFHALQSARRVVKQTHLKHYPSEVLTDREADRFIEALGPEALAKATKFVIDRGGVG